MTVNIVDILIHPQVPLCPSVTLQPHPSPILPLILRQPVIFFFSIICTSLECYMNKILLSVWLASFPLSNYYETPHVVACLIVLPFYC